MSGEEHRELNASIDKVKRGCKLIKYVCLICLIAFLFSWVMLLGAMVLDIVSSGLDSIKLRGIIYILLHGIVISILLFISVRVFSSVVAGESPFTMRQVWRFRIAALVLLALVVVEAFVAVGFSQTVQLLGTDMIYDGGYALDRDQIDINIMALFFAAMVFGISVVFQYGSLLQRLNDETV